MCLIIECENSIKKDYPNFNIKLIIKPFETTIKELDNYDSDDEEETPYTILCNKILADATSRKLKKDENHIYIKHSKYPLTYERLYKIENGFKNDESTIRNILKIYLEKIQICMIIISCWCSIYISRIMNIIK